MVLGKKILIVGAGSGRDMVSVIALFDSLKRYGVEEIHLAGFLTPWAIHTFKGKWERPINKIEEGAKKYLAHKPDVPLPSFFEPHLLKLVKESAYPVTEFLGFSLQFGTKVLQKKVRKLVYNHRYDAVLVVDIGGDILAHPLQSEQAWTPIVDQSCLSVFTKLKIPTYLILMGIGSDGELSVKQIRKKIDQVASTQILTRNITRLASYRCMLRINDALSGITSKKSGTIEILKKKKCGRSIWYRRIFHAGTYTTIKKYRHRIDWEFLKHVVACDLNEVAKLLGTLPFYRSLLEAQAMIRPYVFGTEIDLSTVATWSRGKPTQPILMLNPSNRLLSSKERELLITEGLRWAREYHIKVSSH